MSKLSTSFTLGKASSAHGANVKHNNREFLAGNIDPTRTAGNVTYVKLDVEETYRELFGEALNEYNARQKRNDRKIEDYYEHILNGNREEAFYEIVVQFGDSKNSPVGSSNGELAQKMLDEYIRGFKARNPNLKIFNCVLHVDEASPHAHINFIPFYTKGRKNGLSKGVSMKAALDEQGFTAKNFKENRLVAWEDSEREVMEKILNRYGLEREIKKAKDAHQNVGEYKETQDYKKLRELSKRKPPTENITEDNIRKLETDKSLLKLENEKLNNEKFSPWKSFYYSSREKQHYVQSKLTESQIPFRETEYGFEAQECYVDEVRQLEKAFKPVQNNQREDLRNILDRIVMQSKSYEDVLERLQHSGYEVKQGKYTAVKPKFGGTFIRLKSLGEDYSEQAIRNRIAGKQKFELDINRKIESSTNQNTLEVVTLKTIRQYTLVFAQGILPVRKINKKKPFTWTNDAELDKLTALNKKLNAGATLESLRNEFAKIEDAISEKEKNLVQLKSELKLFTNLYNAGKRCYELGGTDKGDLEFLAENKITAGIYKKLTMLIGDNETEIAEVEKSLTDEQGKLKKAVDIFGVAEKVSAETYVQSLIEAESEQRKSAVLRNGLRRAD